MNQRDKKRIATAVAALQGLRSETDELAQLRLVRRAVGAVEKIELAQVEVARKAGHTWGEIGDLYGLTKQGAQQRFARG